MDVSEEEFEEFVFLYLAVNHYSMLKFLKRRFNTIECVFTCKDKFKRLLLRFEHIDDLHYAFKTLAYTRINLRHFCQR